MLAQGRRQWANIKSTLVQCPVLAFLTYLSFLCTVKVLRRSLLVMLFRPSLTFMHKSRITMNTIFDMSRRWARSTDVLDAVIG